MVRFWNVRKYRLNFFFNLLSICICKRVSPFFDAYPVSDCIVSHIKKTQVTNTYATYVETFYSTRNRTPNVVNGIFYASHNLVSDGGYTQLIEISNDFYLVLLFNNYFLREKIKYRVKN